VTGQLNREIEEDREGCVREVEELRRSNRRLIDFIATGIDIMWETDAELRLVSGLQIARRGEVLDVESPSHNAYLVGATVAEILGKNPICEPPLQTHLSELAARKPFRAFRCRIPLADGTTIWTESSGNPIFGEGGVFQGYRGTSRDITRRKNDEERIEFLAHHDVLTRLPNRLLFRERIEQALAGTGRGTAFTVMLLDLDLFKMVNDTLGHPVGDLLLRAVAERLSSNLRDVDTVARLGGDEFAIVQAGAERPEQAALLAERLVDVIAQPYELSGHHVRVRVTIGIALAPSDGASVEQLLKNADIALYRAKADEPGTWRFFKPDMGACLEARRVLEVELRGALSNGEFEIYYQPVHNTRSGQISAFEAVLQWRHPRRGLVQPADFILVAEETGMMVPIGDWVLQQALAEAAKWPADVSLVVSLSPVQLRNPALVATIKGALVAAACSGNKLELQIPEASLAQNGDATVATLRQLRGLGARICLADFGTGPSSLRYLRSSSFDKIRIDRSFIGDLTENGGRNAIVRALAGLGRRLSFAGSDSVWTQEQFIVLQDEGCTEVQGRLFDPPGTAKDIPFILEKSREHACDRLSLIDRYTFSLPGIVAVAHESLLGVDGGAS
jgi:diguanylate cyclase (GGDEF)-like protein